MEYSVLTQPVIPVLMPDGTGKSVGIREAFLKAHEIKDIQGDTPLERYALLRLLIAMAMDMLALKTSDDRYDLLQQGAFDAQTFEDYVRECEKDGPRFDLFDEEHPFLQSKYDEEMDSKAQKPVGALFPALPKGNNHTFLDHRQEDVHVKTPAQALRGICCIQLFCTAGAQGYPSGVNNTPPVYAVVIGKSLFETIVFNMLSKSEAGNIPYGICEVPWRNGKQTIPKQAVPAVSLLEGLTLQPRRITLIQDADGLIRRIYFQQGRDFKGNELWQDPHVPRFLKKDMTYGTVKPQSGRALWRDVGTVVYMKNADHIMCPAVIGLLSNILDDIPQFVSIRMVGVVTNQAAYVSWSEDELSLPSKLLEDEWAAQLFRDDVSVIEQVQRLISWAVSQAGMEKEIGVQAVEHFLHSAHAILFGTVMDEVTGSMSERDHVMHFGGMVHDLVMDTIRAVIQYAGNGKSALEQQVKVEQTLIGSLKKQQKEREKRYAE